MVPMGGTTLWDLTSLTMSDQCINNDAISGNDVIILLFIVNHSKYHCVLLSLFFLSKLD